MESELKIKAATRPLSQEQIADIFMRREVSWIDGRGPGFNYVKFAREIEEAHGIVALAPDPLKHAAK